MPVATQWSLHGGKRQAKPGLVVISNSYIWFRDSRGFAIGSPGESPSQVPEVKLAALSSSLSSAVRALQNAGHDVLLVQAVPHWGDVSASLSWAGCSTIDMVTRGCSRTMPLGEARERQGAITDVVAHVASETRAAVLDLTAEFCPYGTCASVTSDGLIRYRDGVHITVEQSRALTETFAKAIAAVG